VFDSRQGQYFIFSTALYRKTIAGCLPGDGTVRGINPTTQLHPVPRSKTVELCLDYLTSSRNSAQVRTGTLPLASKEDEACIVTPGLNGSRAESHKGPREHKLSCEKYCYHVPLISIINTTSTKLRANKHKETIIKYFRRYAKSHID
jgi:hypothetical protein